MPSVKEITCSHMENQFVLKQAAIIKVAAPSHLTTHSEVPVSFLGGSLTLLLSF